MTTLSPDSARGFDRGGRESRPRGAAVERRVRFIVKSNEDPLAGDGPNVIRNLSSHPKRISPVYVYDREGSLLFERQCDTPEYYLRRAETRLLGAHAREFVELCGFAPLVELGAGTAQKTRIVLAEYARRARRCDYYPIDVDTETLVDASRTLTSIFPRLHVHCVGATYEKGLEALPRGSRGRLFLFLGSSLGNMERQDIDDLLSRLASHGTKGDHLLLGVDLDKDPAIINRAYNDSAGWGPRSTLNMLSHLNRRYDGNFQARNFAYRSEYNAPLRRNEVRIESLVDQRVTLSGLGFSVSFAKSELIEAEVMYKFDPDDLGSMLDQAGFPVVGRWIDSVQRYGLFLSQYRAPRSAAPHRIDPGDHPDR